MTDRPHRRYAVLGVLAVVGLAVALHFWERPPIEMPPLETPPELKAPNRRALNALRDGVDQFKVGDFKAALDSYTEALDHAPKYPEALCNRSNVYLALGNNEAAIQDATRALRFRPGYSLALGHRALAHQRLKHYAEAVADGEAAIEADAENLPALNAQAFRLASCPDGKYRNGPLAVELAERLCKLDPTPKHMLTLSLAYAEVGSFVEALELIEEVLPRLEGLEREKASGLRAMFRQRLAYRGD